MYIGTRVYLFVDCRLITIGPFVSLDAIAQGHLDLAVTADIHLAYDFNDLELWYPKAHSNLTKEKGVKSKDTGETFGRVSTRHS